MLIQASATSVIRRRTWYRYPVGRGLLRGDALKNCAGLNSGVVMEKSVDLKSKQHGKKLTWQARSVLLFVGVCSSLLALEVVVRVVGVLAGHNGWSDRPYAFFMPSHAHSLQDSDRHPKAPGVFRIAVVGDSFTFGPHLQLVDTFPKKLEQLLNVGASGSGARVEVLNRGHNGASTVVEVELVRRALEESPDLLVLEVTLNDAEPQPLSPQERAAMFRPEWLHWRIFSVWRSLGFVAKRINNTRAVQNYIEYHRKFFEQPETHAQFFAALQKIAAQAQGAKVPLVGVIFPLFDFVINDGYPFKATHTLIERDLAQAGIGVIDLLRAYRNIPPERLQVIPGEDNHPNEIAHRIAAEHLLAALVHDHLVPEAVAPAHLYPFRKHQKEDSIQPGKALARAARRVHPTPAPSGS